MQAFAQPEELKTLLDTQKDLSQLEDIGELLIIIMRQNITDMKYCLVKKPFFPFDFVTLTASAMSCLSRVIHC